MNLLVGAITMVTLVPPGVDAVVNVPTAGGQEERAAKASRWETAVLWLQT